MGVFVDAGVSPAGSVDFAMKKPTPAIDAEWNRMLSRYTLDAQQQFGQEFELARPVIERDWLGEFELPLPQRPGGVLDWLPGASEAEYLDTVMRLVEAGVLSNSDGARMLGDRKPKKQPDAMVNVNSALKKIYGPQFTGAKVCSCPEFSPFPCTNAVTTSKPVPQGISGKLIHACGSHTSWLEEQVSQEAAAPKCTASWCGTISHHWGMADVITRGSFTFCSQSCVEKRDQWLAKLDSVNRRFSDATAARLLKGAGEARPTWDDRMAEARKASSQFWGEVAKPAPWKCADSKCTTPTAGPDQKFNKSMCVACADIRVFFITDSMDKAAAMEPPKPEPVAYVAPRESVVGGYRWVPNGRWGQFR